jgi:hypothetical protein
MFTRRRFVRRNVPAAPLRAPQLVQHSTRPALRHAVAAPEHLEHATPPAAASPGSQDSRGVLL